MSPLPTLPTLEATQLWDLEPPDLPTAVTNLGELEGGAAVIASGIGVAPINPSRHNGVVRPYALSVAIMLVLGAPSAFAQDESPLDKALQEAGAGHLVKARADLVAITEAPVPDGGTDLREQAKRQLDLLTPRIPRVHIIVPPDVLIVGVTMDGVPLDRSRVDELRRVDPGEHVIVASAMGGIISKPAIVMAEEGKTAAATLSFVNDATTDDPVLSKWRRENSRHTVSWGPVGLGAVLLTFGTVVSAFAFSSGYPVGFVPVVGPFIGMKQVADNDHGGFLDFSGFVEMIFLCTGVIRVVGGSFLTLGLFGSQQSSVAVHVVPTLTASGRGIGVGGQF